MYFSPSSPGEKVKAEQNPSEELISRVEPSFDLDFWLASFIMRRVFKPTM